jgi:polyphosphate glucokinase
MARMHTLAIDCGGSGIKGSVLDEAGAMVAARVRLPTPYPLPPERLVETLQGLAAQLPEFDRVTVGMPGMIRHGVVVATPHYVTRRGPRSKRVPELVAAWDHFDARAALADAFGRPALVLNDAEVHGAGVVRGEGLEVVWTLGTGLGCAVFDAGRLAPHLELSHAPVRRDVVFDTYIGDRDRRSLGNARWSRRVGRAVQVMRPVFRWDVLYLGGGNAKRVAPGRLAELGPEVVVVPNAAGILGGVRAWELDTT